MQLFTGENMAAASRFSEVITTEEQLRAIIGHPHKVVIDKTVHELDEYSRGFIAQSPFLLIGSVNAAGKMDVSPKGDPAGFVHVFDDHTLLIPDRPGNRRADTFTNILQNPQIGLLFLIPGNRETLRVNGMAMIVRDPALQEQMAERGKVPHLLLAVTVEEVFFHCAKCVVRSDLWNAERWPDLEHVPSIAEALIKHAKIENVTIEEVEADLEADSRLGLY
jgi:uncharacterized protein